MPNQKATLQNKRFSNDGTGTNLYWRDLDDAHFNICKNRNRIFPVSTSQTSSPLHHAHSTAYSCPTIPSETPVVTKSTQTEPLVAKLSYDNQLSNWMCQNEDVQEKTSLCALSEKVPKHHIGISNNIHGYKNNVPPRTSFVYRNRSFTFPSVEGRNSLQYCEDKISAKNVDCNETSKKYSQKAKNFQPVPTKLDDIRWIQNSRDGSEPFNKEVRFYEDLKGSSGLMYVITKQPERKSKVNVVKKKKKARKEKHKKRNNISRNKNIIPDCMEMSEKGSASMESEATDLTCSNVIISPKTNNDSVFPSVPDSFLKHLGLHKEIPYRNEHLSEQEVESKCGSLLLAFKIDKLTLSKRLQLQQRQRNIAEKNVENAIHALKISLNTLNRLSTDHQVRELIVSMYQQIDILQQSFSRVSSRAEVYGAVQQEDRMNRAFEVMVMYVENMKHIYQKEPHELKETRKLVTKSHVVPVNCVSALEDGRDQQSFCYLSIANLPSFVSDLSSHFVHLQAIKKVYRRASIEMFCRASSIEPYPNPVLSSFSIVQDSRSHSFPSNGPSSGKVDSTNSNSLMTKLTFSVVSSSIPSSTRRRCYSLPAILPTDFAKPTASLSLPIRVKEDINEATEFHLQNRKSGENTSTYDPNNKSGNSNEKSYKNTEDKQEKKKRPKSTLRNTEALSTKTEFEILCQLYKDPEAIDNVNKKVITEHRAVKNRTIGGNTSYLRGIYNKLVNKDSATICERFRFGISVILIIAGFLSLLLTFLPYQASANAYHTYPISVEEIVEILLSPYLSLKPPSNVI